MNGHLEINGPVGSRTFLLEAKCQVNEGHKHNYDHAMLVIRGRVKVFYRHEKDGKLVEGETEEFGQGKILTVMKDVHHTIKALEPNTLYFCLFSHRDFDGLVSESYTGNAESYT